MTAPSASWLTCPVCDWTDAALDGPAMVNSLFEAQRSFARTGAASADGLARVRPPAADEARPVEWHALPGVPDGPSPREAERGALVTLIANAFAGVSPEGRETLRRAYRYDYDAEPDVDWVDDDTSWDRIPPYVLEFFGTTTNTFTFGNPQGFRYYMPAFMTHSLRTGSATTSVRALDLKLAPGHPPHELAEIQLLDGAQRRAVAAFLRHVVTYEAPAPWAERALERIWALVAAEGGAPPRANGEEGDPLH